MYLDNMLALPVISNPAWVFPRRTFESVDAVFDFAAVIIEGISQFKQDLEK
jgi:hypothetical protein